jgi:spore coat protein H
VRRDGPGDGPAGRPRVELNGRKVGFYVLKEGFDKTFLKRHFKDDNGNLYDGGFLQDVDAPLQLDSGTANGHKDLRAVLEACQGLSPGKLGRFSLVAGGAAFTEVRRDPNGDKRFAGLNKLVDVDKLITMAALQVIATDWDGYCRNRNNYRIYFVPNGRAVFMPHGMDQMFQNPGEGLWPGWGGLVARTVLETPEGRKRYIARLREMTDKVFVLDKLYKRIDEFVPRGKAALTTVDKGWANNWENEIRNYKQRLKERNDVLKRELARQK